MAEEDCWIWSTWKVEKERNMQVALCSIKPHVKGVDILTDIRGRILFMGIACIVFFCDFCLLG